MPSVVFHIIGLCLWLIGVVVVLILFFAASDKLAEVMNEVFGVKGEVTFGVACLFMIGLALAAGLVLLYPLLQCPIYVYFSRIHYVFFC